MAELSFRKFLSQHNDIAAGFDAVSHLRRVIKGNIIVGQGDHDNDMYVLTSGRAKVVVYSEGGHEVHLADFKEGHMFGEMAALLNAPRSSNVLAQTDCSLEIVSSADFNNLMERFPALALYMTRILASRLHQTSQSLFESLAFTVPQRAYEYLSRRAEPHPDDPELFTIKPAPSVTSLSESLNVSREATSRAISKLSARGLLKRSKPQWDIIRPEFSEV